MSGNKHEKGWRMNRTSETVVLAVALSLGACSDGEPETLEQRASYAIGTQFGNNLKQTPAEIDIDMLIAGLQDALADREPRLTPQEMSQVMREFTAKAQQEMAQRQQALLETNRAEGAAFLADNRTKTGVIETASGLQYEVITQGDGESPAATDMVTVHYHGTLISGNVFDSSVERGEPSTFRLNEVIAGWTEGVQLMNIGSKYRFFIPGELGYGERGRGPDIEPNATLVFEVELLAIER